jgi:hypothetical protein
MWNLIIGASLGFGAWDLDLSIRHRHIIRITSLLLDVDTELLHRQLYPLSCLLGRRTRPTAPPSEKSHSARFGWGALPKYAKWPLVCRCWVFSNQGLGEKITHYERKSRITKQVVTQNPLLRPEILYGMSHACVLLR